MRRKRNENQMDDLEQFAYLKEIKGYKMEIIFVCRSVASNTYPTMNSVNASKKTSYSASLEIAKGQNMTGTLYITSDEQIFQLDQKYTLCVDDTDD